MLSDLIEKVFAERVNFGRWIEVNLATRENSRGEWGVVQPVTFEKRSPDDALGYPSTPPAFKLAPNAAQELMDQLWTCGIRPTEGAGSAGAMAATQKHLEDMRTIAMGALKERGVIEEGAPRVR